MAKYWIIENGRQAGPFEKEELLQHGLSPNSPVWAEGMPDWAPAATVADLSDIIPPAPATPPPYYNAYQQAVPRQYAKDRILTGLFALLLGGLGIHYFYLGKVMPGIVCILATIVSCGIWQIITLIQGIMMLIMSDEEFNSKYVETTNSFPLF
ncbi:MAG: DUF4339 domain-containing protein [Muribaculaceae bacterium]|nr:DUF4339 domain-containing protein [Muribaculaceae bacterium]